MEVAVAQQQAPTLPAPCRGKRGGTHRVQATRRPTDPPDTRIAVRVAYCPLQGCERPTGGVVDGGNHQARAGQGRLG